MIGLYIREHVLAYFEELSSISYGRLSYELAAANYGIEYDDLMMIVATGTKKRLMFGEDDFKIRNYLKGKSLDDINWDELIKLYPKHNEIISIKKGQSVYVPFFNNDDECLRFIINKRWSGNPICPYCTYSEKVYNIEGGRRYKCGNNSCYKKFSATTGSVMHASNNSLIKWVEAIYILFGKNGGNVSTIKLADYLGVTQKTAWIMVDKLRKNKDDILVQKIRTGNFNIPLRLITSKIK